MTKEACALVFDHHHASYRHRKLFPNHLVPVDIVKLFTERQWAQSGAAEKADAKMETPTTKQCRLAWWRFFCSAS